MIQDRLKQALLTLKEDGVYRVLNSPTGDSTDSQYSEGRYLDFTSNDYLNLASDQVLWDRFLTTIQKETRRQFGSTGSRLLSGNTAIVQTVEHTLTHLYGRPVLCFNSGYQANVGVISCVASKGDVIFADKYCHASMLDGSQLSGAKLIRYRHQDIDHLTQLLTTHRSAYRDAWILTESVFSMAGTVSDLNRLCVLKATFNAGLMVDEAHAFGVRGSSGLGVAQEVDCLNKIDLLIGTFGKAAGSSGAFVVGDSILIDYLINRSRAFIYSTALPVPVWVWNGLALARIVRSDDQRTSIDRNRRHLIAALDAIQTMWSTSGMTGAPQPKWFSGWGKSASHIVPIILGENQTVVAASQQLKNQGMITLPIRTPTVPKGSARLRLSLTAGHTLPELDQLVRALSALLSTPLSKGKDNPA